MSQDLSSRLLLYEELLRRFASGVRAAQLYAADHPLLGKNVEGLLAALRGLHPHNPSVAIGIVGNQLVVADTPMPKASAGMAELIKRLRDHEIERIAFDRGVTPDEVTAFVHAIASLGNKGAAEQPPQFPHIHVGRINADERRNDGIGSDMAAIRQLYSNAVSAAQTVWESATVEGMPDVPAALQAVEGLAEAVTQNRTALVALTAMRNYDNYTFTHMVNVSILTMGQARALGIEGRLLREFGLSALMHDIGKVRTPKEILNKPDKLTDEEFVIMRRHTVDGAEILRRTPEMPILAPVVAFEHHLRLDGTGYPFGRAPGIAQRRDDALQHLGHLRRDAVAARLSAGLPHRAHPRGAEAQRRHAVRSAPRPAVRAAPGHLPARQPGAAVDRRGGGRGKSARARSVSSARARAVQRVRRTTRSAVPIETSGNRRIPARKRTASSGRSIRRSSASTR